MVARLRRAHIDKDGKINKQDFRKVVFDVIGPASNGGKGGSASSSSTSSTSSTSTSGGGGSKAESKVTTDKMELLFKVLDSDGDGLLDLKELERHHTGMFKNSQHWAGLAG